jgi:hypothetical protein
MQLLLVKSQERLVSLIRVLPLGSVEVNSNSYWSDQTGLTQGQVRPGQLACYKQELANT